MNKNYKDEKPIEIIGGEDRSSTPPLLSSVTRKVGQAVAGTVENSVDIVGVACEKVSQVFDSNKCNEL